MKISAARGFTIIEVMVGAAVALLVIGIVMGTFLTQQRSLQAMDLSREASNGARDAMFSLQQSIGRAGYGVAIQTVAGQAADMSAAFDFEGSPGVMTPVSSNSR